MANVKFVKGSASAYTASAKDENTFYYTTDDKNLYLGSVKLSNAADLEAALIRVAANETKIGTTELTTSAKNLSDAVNELKTNLSSLTGGESGGINDMIKAVTGDLSTLTTDSKGTLVAAINELDAALDAEKTASKVTIDTTTTTEGMSKSYTVKQGTNLIGTIDIPKDMVVTSGTVETKTEEGTWGQPGTYIHLIVANDTLDDLYVNVGTLVDIYTAEASASKVQLTIDQSTNTISATIVAGAVTSTELADNAVIEAKIADNAVTTGKIADKNVTKAKLADEIVTSLGKADSAVQSVTANTAATEEAKGTILVDSVAVKVNGLGSAAYTNSNDYDVAGSANTVKSDLIGSTSDTADSDTIKGAKLYTDKKVAENALVWGTIE